MIKLFTTLTVMVILPIIIYVLMLEGVLDFALKDTLHAYQQKVSKGTVVMLNKRVADLDGKLRDQEVKKLRKEFVYPLNLKPMSDYEFDQEELSYLARGLTVGEEVDDVTTLFAMLPGTDLVWAFEMDQSDGLDEANTAAGTLYLIEQDLLKHSLGSRVAQLQKIRASFGFDLELVSLESLVFTREQLDSLNQGKVVHVHDGSGEYELYKKMSDSQWVIHVPVFESIWFAGHMNMIVISLLLLFVSLFLLFWVWTLWRNLARIQQAAKALGAGDYDVRVPYRKSARLSALSQAFNQMAEQTQSSIRSHKELTSAVSHELRTPVARMRFSLDMLEETDKPDDRQRYVDNMNQDMDELDSLLNELLTYARFDQQGKRLEPTLQSLKPWFNNTMKGLDSLSGGIDLSWNFGGVLDSNLATFDDVLMSRLLNNLVQNGLRHANSKVMATLSQTPEEVTLMVDDDGAGIPENERARLFEAFATQDSSRNKNSNGFGLGLAIVKRVVTAHHGQVAIYDSPLGGAQLVVRWPTNLSIQTESDI